MEHVKITFRHVANSMFNKHLTAAGLHIIRCCYEKIIDKLQYRFLLSGATGGAGEAPDWVPETCKPAFLNFAKSMSELFQKMKMHKPSAASTLGKWVKQPHPEENLPTVDGQQLSKHGVSPFAQLIIISMLALHCLVPAIQSFVTKTLYLGQSSALFEYAYILEDKTSLPMISAKR